jgi:hypothetical protein
MITTWSTVWATSLSTWLEIRMVRPSSARSRSRPRSHAMPSRVEPVGRFVEQQHWRVAE